MAGDRGAHAQNVKEPGTQRRQRPGAKVVVKKGGGIGQIVAAEKPVERVAARGPVFSTCAEVVNESGREIDVSGVPGREGVTVHEAARQAFGRGEASGFADEGGVQVDADKFDSFGRKECARSEPADDVADAAANVYDAKRAYDAAGFDRGEHDLEQFVNAPAVEELFSQAPHFPVDGKHEAVDGLGIEEAIAGRNGADGSHSLAIPEG
jgi:hypothetical protein